MTHDATTAITPERFRAALGQFATGVAVLTTVVRGEPHGMTVNAISSVSLQPPLILVCVDRHAAMASELTDVAAFAVNFLRRDQQDVAQWFADSDRPSGADQFHGITHVTDSVGVAILDPSLGWLRCRMWAQYDGGDHIIVVGEVDGVSASSADDEPEPLVFFRGRYGTFTP